METSTTGTTLLLLAVYCQLFESLRCNNAYIMTPKELIENRKIYSEELQQWVVPLIFVDEALQMKAAQEVDASMKRLEEVMQDLNTVISKIND